MSDINTNANEYREFNKLFEIKGLISVKFGEINDGQEYIVINLKKDSTNSLINIPDKINNYKTKVVFK